MTDYEWCRKVLQAEAVGFRRVAGAWEMSALAAEAAKAAAEAAGDETAAHAAEQRRWRCRERELDKLALADWAEERLTLLAAAEAANQEFDLWGRDPHWPH